jgi:PST family polysaccharide transporter
MGCRRSGDGAVAALICSFLLMAQLSLRLTGLTRSEFVVAHVPGLALAGVIGTSTWALVEGLRALQVSPLLLLVEVVLFAAAEGLLLARAGAVPGTGRPVVAAPAR